MKEDAGAAPALKGLDMQAVDFASLLCSRLCHDLISPVGSLYNGVDLLDDESDPEMRARYMELLADSARQTANKMTFFRVAFVYRKSSVYRKSESLLVV